MAATWTSSNGVVVTIRPVSQFKLDSMRASKKEIPAPIYSVTTAAGEKQEFPMDEIIAENQGRQEEWKAYLSEKSKAEAVYAKKYFSLLVWDGVDIEPSEKWLEEAAYFGMLPENKIERKVQFIYDEVLMTVEDMNDLMAEILLVSQVSKEVVDNLRNSFRSRAAGKANKRMAPKKEPMESTRPDLGDAGSSEVLEHEAIPVGDM